MADYSQTRRVMHASRETPALPGFLTVQSDGVTLAVKVTPRAPRAEIGEALGAELRVKIIAPPVSLRSVRSLATSRRSARRFIASRARA